MGGNKTTLRSFPRKRESSAGSPLSRGRAELDGLGVNQNKSHNGWLIGAVAPGVICVGLNELRVCLHGKDLAREHDGVVDGRGLVETGMARIVAVGRRCAAGAVVGQLFLVG